MPCIGKHRSWNPVSCRTAKGGGKIFAVYYPEPGDQQTGGHCQGAYLGRVDVLWIARNEHQWGEFDVDNGEVKLYQQKTNGSRIYWIMWHCRPCSPMVPCSSQSGIGFPMGAWLPPYIDMSCSHSKKTLGFQYDSAQGQEVLQKQQTEVRVRLTSAAMLRTHRNWVLINS